MISERISIADADESIISASFCYFDILSSVNKMNLNNESLFEAFQHSRGGGDARFADRPVDSRRTAWDPFGKAARVSQPDDLHYELDEAKRIERELVKIVEGL